MDFAQENRFDAKQHFREARKQALVNEILSQLSGKRHDLLSFKDVQQRLGVQSCGIGHLEAVPVAKIVGSEGRYNDFDREFLPLHANTHERWESLDVAYENMANVPPVDLYKVGDVYFVRDGNHRVSVARRRGASYVDAYVIDCPTEVRLSPDADVEDLLVAEEHMQFLLRTGLDRIIGTDIELTAPGAYDALGRHIDGHRYFMGQERGGDVPYEEAAQSWYEQVYQPAVRAIRDAGMLERFPERTEGDLYIWIMEHLFYLRERYGDKISVRDAATSFAEQYGAKRRHRVRDWLMQQLANLGGTVLSWFKR